MYHFNTFINSICQDTASNHTSSHHLESNTLSIASTSNSGEKGGANSASGSSGSDTKSAASHHQYCYEPEPVPALLVSSLDKEWMTISPYAIKYWDKLNLEPYSKQKNIAYVVVMPDFDSEIFDNFNFFNNKTNTNSTEEKDYINYFLK